MPPDNHDYEAEHREARKNLTEVEKDAVRDTFALLRAARDSDESGARVIAENARPVATLTCLAALTVSIAKFAGFDIDDFIEWGFGSINEVEDAA
ncbi:hypothetical protein [Nocardia sp. NPDC059239]|uniref:hypothetical protein n=1 Tax=unclassified Nocardia TaxID=2637762 RepID=UPI0036C40DDC